MTQEKSNTTSTQIAKPAEYNGWGYNLQRVGFASADFTAVVVVTAGAIAAVQSPLKTFSLRLASGSPLLEGNRLAAIGALYRGFSPQLTGGTLRSAYVIGTKDAAKGSAVEINVRKGAYELAGSEEGAALELEKQVDEKRVGDQKSVRMIDRLFHVGLMNLGDISLTHHLDMMGQLQKVQLGSYNWKTWSNFSTITRLGLGSRFVGGMANFGALCILTDVYGKMLPVKNENIKQTLGGFLSGATAAVLTYPFNFYRDYITTQVKAVEGTLVAPRPYNVLAGGLECLKVMSPDERHRQLVTHAKGIGVKMVTTSATFAIIAGVSALMGSAPVSNLLKPEQSNDTKRYKEKLSESKGLSGAPESDSSNTVAKKG